MSDFTPAPTRKHKAGWTVQKQRLFIEQLAIFGSVLTACEVVNMTPASAFRLRNRPGAESFAAAWDMALQRAGGRLMTIAFERATRGGARRVWKNGELTIEEQNPSDRLLMYLLNRLGPPALRSVGTAGEIPSAADLDAHVADLRDAPDDSLPEPTHMDDPPPFDDEWTPPFHPTAVFDQPSS